MLELMAMDKKVKAGALRLVLLDGIGRASVAEDYPREELERLLEERAGA
jgi:3-dehydroquinate synthase